MFRTDTIEGRLNLGVGRGATGREYEYSRMPNNLEGIRGYYLERGYFESPIEMKEEGQVASFAKPIPGETGQSRHHVRIMEKTKSYKVDSHVDNYDPEQNPIGHLTADVLGSPKHNVVRVKKND